jgi:hypothetical protein
MQAKGGLWFSQGATMHNTLDDINWEVYKLAQEVCILELAAHKCFTLSDVSRDMQRTTFRAQMFHNC